MNSIRSWTQGIVFGLALGLGALAATIAWAGAQDQKEMTVAEGTTDVLDGKQFNGLTGEKGKKDHHEDVLTFRNGMFSSSACLPLGFGSGAYTVSVEGGQIKFQAETVSPKLGTMQWQGTLKGDILEVTYSWTKKRWLWTTFRQYWFKGQLVKK